MHAGIDAIALSLLRPIDCPVVCTAGSVFVTTHRIVVGIVGSGFTARGLARALRRSDEFTLGPVLTRRQEANIPGFDDSEIISSIDALIERSGIIVECSGDPLYATDVIERAAEAGRKVVTMSAAWHVLAGSYYHGRGYITEAEGDQPGSLAALAEDGRAMGFEPLVYVNVKSFLNHTPTFEEMSHFSKLYEISLPQVMSFTDGTKLQLEQALVANGLGADILGQGMMGPAVPHIADGLELLARAAHEHGKPIADYVLTCEAPGAVMILARHDAQESAALQWFKMGEGPLYRMVRPYHLCHLEILKTLRRAAAGGSILLDNGSRPTISVAAIAKRNISAGERIEKGIGSFNARGECVRMLEHPGHLPIALLHSAVLTRAIEAGAMIMLDDVEIPDSTALKAWRAIERKTLADGALT